MKKYDVVALGELLIDFTQNGYSEQGNPIFEANPGGAPCNVLAMLQKLGRKTAFIGKVGRDGFGFQLEKALKEAIELNIPCVIDAQIDEDDKVFPMVPAGAPIEDVFDQDDLKKEK